MNKYFTYQKMVLSRIVSKSFAMISKGFFFLFSGCISYAKLVNIITIAETKCNKGGSFCSIQELGSGAKTTR
jgi:hypothetical protein